MFNTVIAKSILLMSALFLSGCMSRDTLESQASNDGDKDMHVIEVLYFDGCPNTPPVIEEAEAVAIDLGDDWRVERVDLESLPANDTRRGYGSPTVLYAGKDLFGLPASSSSALSCRHYPGGNPTRESIRSALGR